MWKELTTYWKETYQKEFNSFNSKLSTSKPEVRVFNNFNEEKVIRSAQNYVSQNLNVKKSETLNR
jgi:hypothetical protein